jgi:hypothetical protein
MIKTNKSLAVCSVSFHATQCGTGENCRSRILEKKFLEAKCWNLRASDTVQS